MRMSLPLHGRDRRMRGHHRIALLAAFFVTARLSAGEAADSGAAMKSDPRSTVVSTPLAVLEATFATGPAAHTLHVRYTVRNASGAPLMTLDRGDSLAMRKHTLTATSIAAPYAKDDAGDLTLSHRALPLAKPAPTVPRVPLAAKLEAGAAASEEFRTDLSATTKRVRYCLGIAPFDPEAFTPFDATALWRASFRIADVQTLLCTPWFSLSAHRFETENP